MTVDTNTFYSIWCAPHIFSPPLSQNSLRGQCYILPQRDLASVIGSCHPTCSKRATPPNANLDSNALSNKILPAPPEILVFLCVSDLHPPIFDTSALTRPCHYRKHMSSSPYPSNSTTLFEAYLGAILKDLTVIDRTIIFACRG